MMNVVHRFFAVTAKISWVLSAVGMVALMLLVTSIVADVVMRFTFNKPITGVRDMLSLFIAAAVSMMLPLLLMLEGNITVMVSQIAHLEHVIKKIKAIKGVKQVYRN